MYEAKLADGSKTERVGLTGKNVPVLHELAEGLTRVPVGVIGADGEVDCLALRDVAQRRWGSPSKLSSSSEAPSLWAISSGLWLGWRRKDCVVESACGNAVEIFPRACFRVGHGESRGCCCLAHNVVLRRFGRQPSMNLPFFAPLTRATVVPSVSMHPGSCPVFSAVPSLCGLCNRSFLMWPLQPFLPYIHVCMCVWSLQ